MAGRHGPGPLEKMEGRPVAAIAHLQAETGDTGGKPQDGKCETFSLTFF